ncbi:MAG: DUF3071 domain-containing protein [Frankiaceae bacterium]|nr:DUF3071 domain-containing protein [Frankiaceae bacterium]MBV9871085.1 DUF3071 domain-containing protein [Frankiaceae bacterium]
MRQLEVVAVSDDGTYVLLASDENAARATHALRIDNRLHAAIRGELDDSDERRESELSPRDIQARLRAGETTEAVAKAAKVPVSRVMRYAGPVISERDRIVGQAQAAVLQRSRGPELSTPLGEVVERRLAATAGLRPETVVWTARRRDDGAWVVELSYTARGGSRTASWLWEPGEREISSLNSLATRLGAEDAPSGRRRAARPSAPRAAAPKPTPRRKAAAARKTAVRTAVARKAAPKPVAKRAAAKPVTKSATKRSAGTPAATAKRTTAKRVPAKAAPKPPAKRTATRAAKSAAAPRRKPRPEPRLIEPQVKRGKDGRVEIPSWDDVLLGVQAPAASRGRRRS